MVKARRAAGHKLLECALANRVSFKPRWAVKVSVHPDEKPPMNATTHSERQALELVDIIDFKWLMAGDGHRVRWLSFGESRSGGGGA